MLSELLILLVSHVSLVAVAQDVSFIYNGFKSSADLSLDGVASFTSSGLLMLTNETKQEKGHAFYPKPVTFKNSSNSSALSFSTSFVFGIVSEYPKLAAHGLAFVIAPTRRLPGSSASQYLGLFNETNNGKVTNHVFAVELDTSRWPEFNDINDNHVGFDTNGLSSVKSTPAGYYADHGVDWVFSHWLSDALLDAKDPNLGTDYVAEEVELVLKLGLVCSHLEPEGRPSMRQVAQILEGYLPLPEISSFDISASGLTFKNRQGFSDFILSYPSSMDKAFSYTSSIAASQLSGGR
ncbi:hypothetical protein K2173_001916 [Erythroxylum novogranatense]|uniref:Legume lectin domain-containing protein n=1 Tax=Erythroxylum novogranatense TaxID=1862640 RepID=A0AAV8SP92_9ROSI|nr:hypothetical protein K2173_001916 [Erythroxylum novogranatense]